MKSFMRRAFDQENMSEVLTFPNPSTTTIAGFSFLVGSGNREHAESVGCPSEGLCRMPRCFKYGETQSVPANHGCDFSNSSGCESVGVGGFE